MTVEPGPAAARWAELAGAATPVRSRGSGPIVPAPTATRWAREVLPAVGGTVLDVGCGGGAASMALVPPATEVVGVDADPRMLTEFVATARAAGVARRAILGPWPEVAGETPVADVVVCHHVLYGVVDIAPFVLALTGRARLAVVVEVDGRAATAPPTGAPGHDDLVAVLREVGLDPEVAVGERVAVRWPGVAEPT